MKTMVRILQCHNKEQWKQFEQVPERTHRKNPYFVPHFRTVCRAAGLSGAILSHTALIRPMQPPDTIPYAF